MQRYLVKLVLPLGLAAGPLAPAHPAEAQALDGRSARLIRDAFLADMDTVHAKITALARAIPDDKYDWRPTPEVRTVSNALMHVATEWYFGLPATVGGKFPAAWPSFPEARAELYPITAKRVVLDQLEKAWAHGRAEVVAASDAQLLTVRADSQLAAARVPVVVGPLPFQKAVFFMAGDLHEHLGQLITYARSLGVKPPWSK